MTVHGADVAELRNLAKNMSAAAAKLDAVRTEISAQLGMPLAWRGPDAQRFTHLWQYEAAQRLGFATASLNNAAAALHRNALEQEVASGVICADVSDGGGATNLAPEQEYLLTNVIPGLAHLPSRFTPLGAAMSVAVGFVQATIPVTEESQNGAMEVGSQRMFGKGVDDLTPEQTAALSRRYTENPIVGVARMISDQMDNTANKVREFFGGLFG